MHVERVDLSDVSRHKLEGKERKSEGGKRKGWARERKIEEKRDCMGKKI
jgi:hypothetical protein